MSSPPALKDWFMASRRRWRWTRCIPLLGLLLCTSAHAQFTGKRRAYATSFWNGTGASGGTHVLSFTADQTYQYFGLSMSGGNRYDVKELEVYRFDY